MIKTSRLYLLIMLGSLAMIVTIATQASATPLPTAPTGQATADSTKGIVPAKPRPTMIVKGAIRDEGTGETIPDATVQVVGSRAATIANKDGCFRLILPREQCRLKITHVGHYSSEAVIEPPATETGATVEKDIVLKSRFIDMGTQRVFTRAYDPAQRIIALAIAHKKDILSRVHDYTFNAYVKLVVRNGDKPDSQSVMLITESQVTSYWQQPDKYKEVITSRKQSANLPAEGNLVAVGGLLNFNRNRLDLGEYSVVSPTAVDAMDHYNYYLLDTVYIDQRAVFVLEAEPKNEYEPLFTGTIQIVDSTFDVVSVDVGLSKGIQIPFINDLRYSQQMAAFGPDGWLPVRTAISFLAKLNIPGLPKTIRADHSASIFDYRIDAGLPGGTFGECVLEVDRDADKLDSLAWAARQMIPLTGLERYGYSRIDSLQKLPKPVWKKLLIGLAAATALVTIGDYDLYHYSRVEGHYLGFGTQWDRHPDLRLQGRAGYGFSSERWQYDIGGSVRLLTDQKLWVGASLKNEIVHRPTIISSAVFNPSFNAFLFKIDPYDYYHQKGYEVTGSLKPIDFTRLNVSFADYRQMSEVARTGHSVFRKSIQHRLNPAITDGDLRAISAGFRYDSRKLINDKGRETISAAEIYAVVEGGFEYSSPDFASSDFDYRRYFLQCRLQTRALGLGTTGLFAYAGKATGTLPPQRYFSLDFHDPDFFKERGFNTFREENFGGDQAATVYLKHDFGHFMFRHSGIGFLKRIPAGLVFHGGAFWSRFANTVSVPGNEYIRTAPTAYSEIGFGFTNLTPFLTPFNMSVYFTWQLSAYDTRPYRWLLSIGF